MPKKYQLSVEQIAELKIAKKKNKNKNVDDRLRALLLRSEGKSNDEVGVLCEYSSSHVSKLVSLYCREGLSAIVDNHYAGNHRNMGVEEEAAFLESYKKQAEQGQIVVVNEIKAAYEKKIGRVVGSSQIYYVLKRQGWRKVMPRSRHPRNESTK